MPKYNSFTLVKAILIFIQVMGIIGSIAQLVVALYALGNMNDKDDRNDQSLKELAAIIMLIMAIISFLCELIGLLGVLMENIPVMSVFAVIMAMSTIISCFTGDGGLKFLIILLNLMMTTLACCFVYMIVKKNETLEFRERNSMSISVINDGADDYGRHDKVHDGYRKSTDGYRPSS